MSTSFPPATSGSYVHTWSSIVSSSSISPLSTSAKDRSLSLFRDTALRSIDGAVSMDRAAKAVSPASGSASSAASRSM